MEEIDYSVLYHWFVGLSLDAPIWSPTTFSKNRNRLPESDIAGAFFDAVRRQADEAGLLSDEPFTVDGNLLEAWASLTAETGQSARRSEPATHSGWVAQETRGMRRRGVAEKQVMIAARQEAGATHRALPIVVGLKWRLGTTVCPGPAQRILARDSRDDEIPVGHGLLRGDVLWSGPSPVISNSWKGSRDSSASKAGLRRCPSGGE